MFKKLPKYRKERIIKLIQACAWFIKRKYGETNVIAEIVIVWLLFEERVGFCDNEICLQRTKYKEHIWKLRIKSCRRKLNTTVKSTYTNA